MSNKNLDLLFISDPGHGWLRVPNSLIRELRLGDKISAFSYEDERYSYLEEDCDAPKFEQVAIEHGYTIANVTFKRSNSESSIRRKKRFFVLPPC